MDDNLRLGMGHWALGIGHWALLFLCSFISPTRFLAAYSCNDN
ncbi:hypothetical protein [Nostoc sp. ATCC 53789]|nr:hypothetical protein [Nostoc sp. ATCC 53789]